MEITKVSTGVLSAEEVKDFTERLKAGERLADDEEISYLEHWAETDGISKDLLRELEGSERMLFLELAVAVFSDELLSEEELIDLTKRQIFGEHVSDEEKRLIRLSVYYDMVSKPKEFISGLIDMGVVSQDQLGIMGEVADGPSDISFGVNLAFDNYKKGLDESDLHSMFVEATGDTELFERVCNEILRQAAEIFSAKGVNDTVYCLRAMMANALVAENKEEIDELLAELLNMVLEAIEIGGVDLAIKIVEAFNVEDNYPELLDVFEFCVEIERPPTS